MKAEVCEPCIACGDYSPVSRLDSGACVECIRNRVEELRKHRPRECVWFVEAGDGWVASRQHTDGAILAKEAAIYDLIHGRA